jgi:two-component system chemotaxis response regulator CheB
MPIHLPARRNIVVIGGSAGGIEALESLVACLPEALPAPIFVVVHLAADSPGVLPSILSRAGKLPAQHPHDGEAIVPGRIYVAPPDRHMLLESKRIRVTHGPKENRFRPAIDPLFRSAALTYGQQVVGIILSGALDDGTAGLWAIKDRGGVAIVQEPVEAANPSMPLSALKYVHVDHRLPVVEIAQVLTRLVGEPVAEGGATPVSDATQANPTQPDAVEIETKIALEGNPIAAGVMNLGPLSPYTCPECNGVLVQLQEGGHLRFRCHTGHAYSVDSLLEGINESIEKTLWNTVRALEENMLLLRHLARHVSEQKNESMARRLASKAQIAEDQVQIMRQLALRSRDQEQVQQMD